MPNKCKWCGMDPAARNTWKCGTRMTPKGSLIQSDACAEIARLKARIEKNRGGDESRSKQLNLITS